MMHEWVLISFFVLAVIQIYLYKIPLKSALKHFWFLGFFYFFLFAFIKGLFIFCELMSLSYCEIPFYLLIILILFGREKSNSFYLFSALWTGAIWFVLLMMFTYELPYLNQDLYLYSFIYSFFPASIFPILAGLREQLMLLETPRIFKGLPIYLMTAGIFFLAINFFLAFIK